MNRVKNNVVAEKIHQRNETASWRNGIRERFKIVYPYGCASSSLADATNFKLVILNPKDENTNETIKRFAHSWIALRHQDKIEMGLRLKEDRLLESDLFYLQRLLRDLFIMKPYQFRFMAT